MPPGPEGDGLYLEMIIELIELIGKSTADADRERFMIDRDKIDVTAYRLAMIGETSRKLSDLIKAAHPEIAWPSLYRMRNIIVHHYERLNPGLVWAVATEQLVALEAVCRQELAKSLS